MSIESRISKIVLREWNPKKIALRNIPSHRTPRRNKNARISLLTTSLRSRRKIRKMIRNAHSQNKLFIWRHLPNHRSRWLMETDSVLVPMNAFRAVIFCNWTRMCRTVNLLTHSKAIWKLEATHTIFIMFSPRIWIHLSIKICKKLKKNKRLRVYTTIPQQTIGRQSWILRISIHNTRMCSSPLAAPKSSQETLIKLRKNWNKNANLTKRSRVTVSMESRASYVLAYYVIKWNKITSHLIASNSHSKEEVWFNQSQTKRKLTNGNYWSTLIRRPSSAITIRTMFMTLRKMRGEQVKSRKSSWTREMASKRYSRVRTSSVKADRNYHQISARPSHTCL